MPQTESPVIELKHIVKRFGSVEALTGVSMSVRKGEVLGLLGDNGAGKSTLVKTLAGVYAPTSGEIWVKGQRREPWTPLSARNAGIETVFQDRALAPQHSIVANIFMGREITNAFGLIDTDRQMSEANRLMREIGFTSKVFSPESIVGNLSGGERQGVAIARAVQQCRCHRAGRANDGFVADRDPKGLSLCRGGQGQRSHGDLHRAQHLSCL